MSPAEAKTKIQALTTELKQHSYNYYVLAMPTIADFDFDKNENELNQLTHQIASILRQNHYFRIVNFPEKPGFMNK